MLLHAQRKYIHKEGFIVKWGYFAVLMAVISYETGKKAFYDQVKRSITTA